MQKRIYINNQIRAKEVRVIDEKGTQMGVFSLEEALNEAKKRNLDLVQVTEKTDPPVCRIIDSGKYFYQLQKKEKKHKTRGGETKGIRLTFGISPHDLEIRAKSADKFLKEGNSIRIELPLRGREKAHQEIAREKIKTFLDALEKLTPIKIERDLKREPRGFSMIITKQ